MISAYQKMSPTKVWQWVGKTGKTSAHTYARAHKLTEYMNVCVCVCVCVCRRHIAWAT